MKMPGYFVEISIEVDTPIIRLEKLVKSSKYCRFIDLSMISRRNMCMWKEENR